ncbi:MAG: CvpA family protein [Flavobacteriaceae bacterium]|nr:CvpA family protein [Flavobacteriaceae bacterium]
MNTFDIILAAILLLGLIKGYSKGLFVEVASLVALIAGVYGAIHFSYFAGDFLTERVSWDEKYINIAAFAITFVIIVVVISLSGKALTKLADFAALGIMNKILGALFGVLKFGLIMSVILMIFSKANNTIPFVGKETLDESILYKPVKSFALTIFPDIIQKGEDQLEDAIGE